MKTASKTRFKQTELGRSESGRSHEWRQTKFAEICVHSAFGPRFSGELYAPNGNVATLRTTDISEDGRIEYTTMPLARLDLSKVQQHILQKDDLVVTRTGRVGTTAVFDGFRLPVLAGAFLIRFRLNRELADPQFYRYYFNSPEGHALITSVATGSVQQNLNITSLHAVLIPVPPLREQRAIAHVLGTLDYRIELNRQINKTLEEMARAIFKHWFIEFEFPNEEGKPYKSSGGKIVDSEVGEVPHSWKVASLDNVAEFTRGFSYSGSEKNRVNGEYLFVTLNSVREGGGFKREFSFITSDRIKDRHFVHGGEIVIANTEQTKTGTLLGYPALVEFPSGYTKDKGVFSHHITKVVPKAKNLKYYLYYYLFAYQQNAVMYNTGSVIWALDVRNWARNEKLPIPPEPVLQQFESLMDTIFRKTKENNLQTETLSHLRDSLLPKLMSEKLRVPVEAR